MKKLHESRPGMPDMRVRHRRKAVTAWLMASALLASLGGAVQAQTPAASPSSVAAADATLSISRSGTRARTPGPAANFTGAVTVDPLFSLAEPQRATGAYVNFAAGARTDWHTHPLGQTLVVTSGTGHVQRWGGAIETIRPGDVVSIKPGEKHWHGAAPDSAMTHLAIGERLGGKTVDWLEKVSDEQYRPAGSGVAVSPVSPAR